MKIFCWDEEDGQKHPAGRVPAHDPRFDGVFILGVAYGILMASSGYPAWLAVLMSVAVYAGSMQFAAVPLLAVPDPLGALLLALLVNARHVFYGISMMDQYRDAGRCRPYLIFALTDETFSVNVSAKVPAGMEPARFYTAVSALDQFYWVAATALGCALGAAASFDTKGISFVMTALFTAIFTGQWLDAKEHRPALVGVGASAACLVCSGPRASSCRPWRPLWAFCCCCGLRLKNKRKGR